MRILLLAALTLISRLAFAQTIGRPLNPWQEGSVEIHFIHTGRGNCSFFILPDGTTFLVDPGEQDPTDPRTLSARQTPLVPDYTKRPYEWIADYIRQYMPAGRPPELDHVLITHYHDDHYGHLYAGAPYDTAGRYYKTGITGLGSELPIRHLMDRGATYPYDFRSEAVRKRFQESKDGREVMATLDNYWKFLEVQQKRSRMRYEVFKVGSNRQIAMVRNPQRYPAFSITNTYSNGDVWTGQEVKHIFPDFRDAAPNVPRPGENQVSCGFRLSYGPFDFYTNTDISGMAELGLPDWYNVESKVAPYLGEMDVITTNHHANTDAMNVDYLRALKPRVIIQEVWSSDHPGHDAFRRMTSRWVYPGERDLFATAMLEANKTVIGPALENTYKSTEGHVVVRVEPGGRQYRIFVLNHRSRGREVLKEFGPYQSK
ncbi:MBL fold metallo-hydrolase [Larkinella soli]|uniref:MBL fold metallo-hydrolase n=1 Tax=Larkinella soli TaxID=1770527 RepID=UPI000FFCAE2B|nr:MBL fold metallo-hydrolase [Larkinella soli]